MAATALTDEQLSRAFAGRTNDALAEAYRRYADVLYAVARGVAGGSDEAQDCVHEAILRVWRIGSYRSERGALRSFLMVCVRNEALSRRRAAARHLELEGREAQAAAQLDPAATYVDHIELARLREALAKLPPEQRTVIELAYFGERTQSQIAAHLGVPLGTVKSRASLALRKLALAIGPDVT